MEDLQDLINLKNLFQIGFLWFIVYWILRYLETTIAGAFLRTAGLIAFLLAFLALLLFKWFELTTLQTIFEYFIIVTFLSIVVIFQPELRHGITRLGRYRFLTKILTRRGMRPDEPGSSVAGEIMKAARRFSKNRIGSMVVCERDVTLQPYIDRAVRVDAAVRAELLDTVFATPTLLHDGAVIVRGERIEAAGAVLPLTQNPDVPKRYGTRHRAAIGITEESDCVVVVTSEETGTVSFCWNGQIRPQEDLVKAEEVLDLLLAGQEPKEEKAA
ncbi:MAG: diadenylate cyclase CdaA [Planctomycetes bacterium]|nr:diadenylate cyclase CdaA [Planctomycetota bacterium]